MCILFLTFSVCNKADIVLLIDSSSSMDEKFSSSSTKMDLSVAFAQKLVKKFKVGLDKFRIAIAKFDKTQDLLLR